MATNNATNTSNPITVGQGGSGTNTLANHGIVVGQGASAVVTKILTDGQVLIGSTGLDPVAASLTAGAGISITPGAGTISISATGSSTWIEVTGVSQAMSVNTNYIANNAGLVTLTLPAAAALGDSFKVLGKGAGGWKVAQNASQFVNIGSSVTTTGVGGSSASTNAFDCITITCTTANNGFIAYSLQGNITVV